jgi:hypothetical protein
MGGRVTYWEQLPGDVFGLPNHMMFPLQKRPKDAQQPLCEKQFRRSSINSLEDIKIEASSIV